jgi:hypothetical protein
MSVMCDARSSCHSQAHPITYTLPWLATACTNDIHTNQHLEVEEHALTQDSHNTAK